MLAADLFVYLGRKIMKKSVVAAAVVVALGAVWVGGAWYTGKTAESEYQRYIDVMNKKMAADAEITGVLGKAEISKFERGVFSSNYALNLKYNFGDMEFNIPTEGTIYHGPLPLNELAKFNFVPAIFSVTNQLVKNEQTQAAFAATEGKNPMYSQMRMTYSKRLQGYMDFNTGNLALPEMDLAWHNAKFNFDTDTQGVGKIDWNMDKFTLLLKGQYIEAVEAKGLKALGVELKHVKAETDLQKTNFDKLYTGFIKLSSDKLNYDYHFEDSTHRLQTFSLKDIKLDYSAKLDQNMFNIDLKTDYIPALNQTELAKVKLDVQLNHLAAQPLNDMLNTHPNNEVALQNFGLELLQNQPQLQIKPLTISNKQGSIDANLNLELANVDFSNLQKHPLSLFKQLSLDLVGNKEVVAEILTAVAQSQGMDKVESEPQIQQQVDMAVDNYKKQGILLEKDGKLSLNLNLEKDGINFNGNHIPENYLGMLLFGLMMQMN